MATSDQPQGSRFVDNLGKVYAMYTLGFLAFFALMAILEQLGAGARLIGILFLCFTIAIYAVIGYLSRTMQVDAYYVAGRQVPRRDRVPEQTADDRDAACDAMAADDVRVGREILGVVGHETRRGELAALDPGRGASADHEEHEELVDAQDPDVE